MRTLMAIALTFCLMAGVAQAQGQRRAANRGNTATPLSLTDRMMQFDKNKDGKLTKSEITDSRLRAIFNRADTDKDGTVTNEELTALEEKEKGADEETDRGGPGGPPPRGGFGGGPGGPGGRGPGGPPGTPGEILPAPLRQALKLTSTQQTQLDALQKDVDSKLAKILTSDQKKQLESMRRRGPGGGPGGPGGGFGPPPDGFGGPGGPPPGGGGFGPPPDGFGGPGGPPPGGPPPEGSARPF